MSSRKYTPGTRERDRRAGKAYEPEAFELLDGLDVTGIGVGARYRPAPAKPHGETQERSWGEAAGDTVVQAAEGVNNVLGSLVNLAAPASGVADFFRGNVEHWRGKQSPVMQRKLAEAEKAISAADQDSIIDQSIAAARAYSSDPALIMRFIATNLPSVLPGLGAAKVAQVARMAAGGTVAMGAAAGTLAAGATEAVMNAGGARGKAFEEVRDTLRKQNYPEEEAVRIALGKSLLPAAVGATTSLVPGRGLLGRALAGRGHAVTGAIASAMLGKQLDDVLPQVAINHQAAEFDGRALSRNVGRTAVEAAVATPPAAGVAALAARRSQAAAAKAAGAGQPDAPAAAATPTPAPVEQQSGASTRAASAEASDAAPAVAVPPARAPRAEVSESTRDPGVGRRADDAGSPVQAPVDTSAAADTAAFDPASVQAGNWPQFVAERGENIGRLRKGTPVWELLQDDWKAVQATRMQAAADRSASEGPGAGNERAASTLVAEDNAQGAPVAGTAERTVDGSSVPGAAPDAAPSVRDGTDGGTAREAAMVNLAEVADAIGAAWPDGPPLRVVSAMKEPRAGNAVRESARTSQAQEAGPDVPAAFYAGGRIHVLADGRHTPRQVARAAFRQALDRRGLRGAFGEGLDAVLDQIVTTRPRDVLSKAREQGLAEGREGRRVAAQDVLVAMAEQTPQMGFVRQAVGAIRSRLRAQLPSIRPMALSDARIIEDFILPAGAWARRGGRPDADAGAPSGAALPAAPRATPVESTADAGGERSEP